MPTLPVRNLAERGVITDAPPAELGSTAWSDGVNVRFQDNAVRRATVFRSARDITMPDTGARGVFGFPSSGDYDRLFVGDTEGFVFEVGGDGVLTDVSHDTLAGSATDEQWTSAVLGDVLYVNHRGKVPSYIVNGGTAFVAMPDWPSDQRARAMGASRDQLFAVNLTQGITELPTTVAWSDYALYGSPPATWDPLYVGGVANEVTLAGARTGLVGCLDLDGVMIVYGERQSWRFTFTGDTSNAAQNLWVNAPLSNDRGAISPNAFAYLERRHFVFGVDDLYTHDGVTTSSVADGRVRRRVFRTLDTEKADQAFVAVDPATDEVLFCYPSKETTVFASTVGCNRAAVLNTRSNTWSFRDLPDLTAATMANFNPTLLWEDAPGAWEAFGGTWADLEDGFTRGLTVLSPATLDAAILALDLADGGVLSLEARAAYNPVASVQRLGYDLDEVGAGLKAAKTISAIIPQVTTAAPGQVVQFRTGASMYPQGPYIWSEWADFDPVANYRLNYRLNGRYLAIEVSVADPVDFSFFGMDVEVVGGGRR